MILNFYNYIIGFLIIVFLWFAILSVSTGSGFFEAVVCAGLIILMDRLKPAIKELKIQDTDYEKRLEHQKIKELYNYVADHIEKSELNFYNRDEDFKKNFIKTLIVEYQKLPINQGKFLNNWVSEDKIRRLTDEFYTKLLTERVNRK